MKKVKKFIPYHRKIEGKTNYKKRLVLLKSGDTRIIVRKTNKHIIVQFANYLPDGDKVIVTANSAELKKFGWTYATGNLPAAYLTGLLAAKKAKAKKVSRAIVDLGLQVPAKGSRLYAAVKGAIDAGVEIPAGDTIFPTDDRLSGKHIVDFAKSGQSFKVNPTTMDKTFADVKKKILG